MIKIVVLPGDGVSPEVVREAVKVLKMAGTRFGTPLEFEEGLVGGPPSTSRARRSRTPLPQETRQLCKACDAILFGAVGDPKWDSLPVDRRPERGLLTLRKELGLYANLRPVKLFAPLVDASPLKREIIEGVDLMVLRELTGGLYFGEPKGIGPAESGQGERGVDTLIYTTQEIERIARIGFQIAAQRRKRLTSIDKVNALASSRLWRRVVTEAAKEFPGIELDHMLVDNCLMQFIRNPRRFDVVLTENTFGDILSDEAAMLAALSGCYPRQARATDQVCTSRSMAPPPQHRWAGQSQPPCHHPFRRDVLTLFTPPRVSSSRYRGCGKPGARCRVPNARYLATRPHGARWHGANG